MHKNQLFIKLLTENEMIKNPINSESPNNRKFRKASKHYYLPEHLTNVGLINRGQN
jgi:hypothetical protein